MKTVNRGFLLIEPRQAYCDWAKSIDPDFDFDESDEPEGTLYLIEDDFFDTEPILEKLFKRILTNECGAVEENEENWPAFTIELFHSWFKTKWGVTVNDTLKGELMTFED